MVPGVATVVVVAGVVVVVDVVVVDVVVVAGDAVVVVVVAGVVTATGNVVDVVVVLVVEVVVVESGVKVSNHGNASFSLTSSGSFSPFHTSTRSPLATNVWNVSDNVCEMRMQPCEAGSSGTLSAP